MKRHKKNESPNPDQITVIMKGVKRFKSNKIVEYLLDHGGLDMNKLTSFGIELKWPKRDWVQFAQLIGYSVSGWGTLSYVADEDWERVHSDCGCTWTLNPEQGT